VQEGQSIPQNTSHHREELGLDSQRIHKTALGLEQGPGRHPQGPYVVYYIASYYFNW